VIKFRLFDWLGLAILAVGVIVSWTGLFMHQTWVSALGALIAFGGVLCVWYGRRRTSGS
jgi:hypothetical protein